MKAKSSTPFLLLLLIFMLACAFYAVIHLRLERGDAYPPGSSFRADPLGGKALFESLESIPGIEVQRNFERLSDVQFDEGTVVIIEAAELFDLENLESDAARPLRDSIAHGARLVVAMSHRARGDSSWEDDSESEEKEEGIESEAEEEAVIEHNETTMLPGLHFTEALSDETVGPGSAELDEAVAKEASLPSDLPWQTTAYWDGLSKHWETVYVLNDQAVIAQRPFGRGTIVIMADSYLLSNEGLLKHRETDLLTWLIADKSVVVFDETHFGVTEPQGIALLMRSYKLGPLALGLAFLVGLFVWKHLSTLVPPQEDFAERESVVRVDRTGQDAQAEFIRRRLDSETMLDECVDLWARTSGRNDAESTKRIAKARGIAKREGLKSIRKRDLATAYQEISKILNANRKN